MSSSSSKKYELDLAYQKEKVHTYETHAIRYTDLSRMVGRNFNQIFEQSMKFDDNEGEDDQSDKQGGAKPADESRGDQIQELSPPSDKRPSNSQESQ